MPKLDKLIMPKSHIIQHCALWSDKKKCAESVELEWDESVYNQKPPQTKHITVMKTQKLFLFNW